jgi:hypothetical protein
MQGPFSLQLIHSQLRSTCIGMQGKARSEFAERWDLESSGMLSFEQMLLNEQMQPGCRVFGGNQLDR